MFRCLLVVAALLLSPGLGGAETPDMLELRGATMGTRYMVKIFDPPEFDRSVKLAIDAELRSVNDQMSTYLKSSELSQFNDSESTDWFAVSRDTAMVVGYAQQVSEKTSGAFDVTVGPLVGAWSFGPQPRTYEVPDDAVLDQIRASVGYQKLSVRMDPPALRKSVPELQVDLSALAKGHGVDRVVELLDSMGAANVFVEIGGEVRTSGSKAGQPWRVGIQVPDAKANEVMLGHPMSVDGGADESMATSGDYRNVFEVDGKQYSHTIDPVTGRPVKHNLASVSVIAPTCMVADAWATAINVMGKQRGLALAQQEQLDVLLVSRTSQGFEFAGTGALAQYVASANSPSAAGGGSQESNSESSGNGLLVIPILTFAGFGVILVAMAVGVIFGRRAISGSCGGLSNAPNEDGSVSCSLCSNPADACKELRERMREAKAESS